MGVPDSYVGARLARAEIFARSQKKSVFEILCEWWETDRTQTQFNQGATGATKATAPQENKSYDLEDFWQAAIERSYAEMSGELT